MIRSEQMTRKIGVIGMGNVGSTVAHDIIAKGLADDLVLIDTNEAKVNADALDFADAMANASFHVNLTVNDYAALKDADVVISAIGNIQMLQDNTNNDRFVELPFTSKQAVNVAVKIKESGFNGVLVGITNPCDVITSIYQALTELPKNQVIGTGTLLDSARMKRAVGTVFKIDPRSVGGYNLGEHGNSQFTAWSTVSVLGKAINELAKEQPVDFVELDEIARAGGFTVLHGKKYTNYGIATAAVRLASIIISDARAELPVSNFRQEYNTYLSYPAIVGKSGIVESLQLDLTKEEEQKLAQSAEYIQSKLEETKTYLQIN